MKETKTFVVFDHTSKNELGKASVHIVRDDTMAGVESLWNELNNAKHDGRKIAVYELGRCVLD